MQKSCVRAVTIFMTTHKLYSASLDSKSIIPYFKMHQHVLVARPSKGVELNTTCSKCCIYHWSWRTQVNCTMNLHHTFNLIIIINLITGNCCFSSVWAHFFLPPFDFLPPPPPPLAPPPAELV